MVIDASALLALLQQEPEAADYARLVSNDPIRLVSAISALESAVVIESRKGPAGGRDLDLLLGRINAEVVAFSAAQFALARTAYRTFGKGHHPAGLNLGDCCSYALARLTGEPLLAKGNDLPQTGINMVREE